jgi:mannose-1-phosphate guanylyltransferase
VVEPEPLGTAGAIRFAADALGDELEERFLALNGDVLTDLDLGALLGAHGEWAATATIGLHPVEDSSAFGLVQSDQGGRVLEFLEKTGEREPGEVNAGMYVLERAVLDLIPAGENVSIERDVFPRLAGHGLHGLRLDGYWMDIGTPERYLQASWDILEGRVATRVEPTSPGVLIDPGAEVADTATVGPRAVVGPGCRVEPGADLRQAVLLDGCTVREDARVLASILSAGAEVPAGAVVEGVVAGEGERLPA